MNNNIKYLVEDYFTNTEQLTNTMKNTAKAQKKYEKENDGRHMFLMNAMGKPLYNKVLKHGAVGTFAPIPLSALKITLSDFESFRVMNGYDTKDDALMDVIAWIDRYYFSHDFKIVNNQLYTDIFYIDIDEIIDLYIAIWKAFNTVYRVKYPKEDISFDPFNKKFRKYFA